MNLSLCVAEHGAESRKGRRCIKLQNQRLADAQKLLGMMAADLGTIQTSDSPSPKVPSTAAEPAGAPEISLPSPLASLGPEYLDSSFEPEDEDSFEEYENFEYMQSRSEWSPPADPPDSKKSRSGAHADMDFSFSSCDGPICGEELAQLGWPRMDGEDV